MRYLFFFSWYLATSGLAQDYLLRDVNVVDPEKRTITRADVTIRHGRIESVGKAPAGKFSGKTLSVAGKYVVPGFTDAHDHSMLGNPGPAGASERLTSEEVARRMLYAGVTSFLDLMADENKIFKVREALRAGKIAGARLFAAGPMVTCTGGHGADFGYPAQIVDSPEDARREIAKLAAKKPDVVKIAYDHAREYPSMNKATMEAVIATAKKFKLKTVVHIGNWQDAQEATAAGVDVVTHLFETEIPDALVKLMKEKGTWEMPTMTYQTELLHILENRSLLDSPLLQALISPPLLAAYRAMKPTGDAYVTKVLTSQVAGRDSYPKSVKKLFDGGIPLMAGTDSGDIGVFQGYSLHREMAILAQSGVDPWPALASGTTLPKKFLNLPSGIAVGDVADLVVLNHSPIEDTGNTRDIDVVIFKGKEVDRTQLLSSKR